MFIAVDGIDGAGKTTLVSQLSALLVSFQPLTTKEPTNLSEWGRRLRESAKTGRLTKELEIEYFHKDRLFHIENIIRPALEQGRVVLTDRYVDSTLAFQSETIEEANTLYNSFKDEILIPDVTFILVCSVDDGLDRITRGRLERTTFEMRETLEQARLIYESRKGDHYVFLDASGTIESTYKQACSELIRRYASLISHEIGRIEPDDIDRCWVNDGPKSLKAAAGS